MIPKDNGSRYIFINGNLFDTEKEKCDIDFERSGATRIYEVIHVTDGSIVCLKEHYERLLNSSKMTGVKGIPTIDNIRFYVNTLLLMNKKKDCNFKLICTDKGDETCDTILYFNTYNISPKCVYGVKEGIEATTFEWERVNPNAKVGRNDYINAVNECKKKNPGSFELILKNKKGCYTEGSMSNFYAIKGNTLYTAPKKEVLGGTMRMIVLDICKMAGIRICYRSPSEKDVKEKFDAAFISSTPVNILPIRSIDGVALNSLSNPLLLKIMHEFDIMIKKQAD